METAPVLMSGIEAKPGGQEWKYHVSHDFDPLKKCLPGGLCLHLHTWGIKSCFRPSLPLNQGGEGGNENRNRVRQLRLKIRKIR